MIFCELIIGQGFADAAGENERLGGLSAWSPMHERKMPPNSPHDPVFIDKRRMDFEDQVPHAIKHRFALAQHGFLGAFDVELQKRNFRQCLLRDESGKRDRLGRLDAARGRELVNAAARAPGGRAEFQRTRRLPQRERVRAPAQFRIRVSGFEKCRRRAPGMHRGIGTRDQHGKREKSGVRSAVDNGRCSRGIAREDLRGEGVFASEQDFLKCKSVHRTHPEWMPAEAAAELPPVQRRQPVREAEEQSAGKPTGDKTRSLCDRVPLAAPGACAIHRCAFHGEETQPRSCSRVRSARRARERR
jgi:hypothetical protein